MNYSPKTVVQLLAIRLNQFVLFFYFVVVRLQSFFRLNLSAVRPTVRGSLWSVRIFVWNYLDWSVVIFRWQHLIMKWQPVMMHFVYQFSLSIRIMHVYCDDRPHFVHDNCPLRIFSYLFAVMFRRNSDNVCDDVESCRGVEFPYELVWTLLWYAMVAAESFQFLGLMVCPLICCVGNNGASKYLRMRSNLNHDFWPTTCMDWNWKRIVEISTKPIYDM